MKCKHLRPEGATTYSWVGPTKMQKLFKGPRLRQVPELMFFFELYNHLHFGKEALRKSTCSHFDLLNMSYAIKERANCDVDAITGALQYIAAGE